MKIDLKSLYAPNHITNLYNNCFPFVKKTGGDWITLKIHETILILTYSKVNKQKWKVHTD